MRIWLLLLTACAARPPAPLTPPAAQARAEYVVAIDAELEQLTVDLCFPSTVPARLIPGTPLGAERVRVVARAGPKVEQTLTIEAGGVSLAGWPPGSCLRFEAEAAALEAASGERFGTSDARFLWPALWLWRPAAPPLDWSATLRFDLPPGVKVSAPWPADGEGVRTLNRSVLTTRARVVVGRFPQWIEEVAGSRLEVSAVGSLPAPSVLGPWVRASATGVAAIFGRFPRPEAQVLLIGEPGRGVIFGAALRGGGPAVSLWVGTRSTAEDLRKDWTLSHELFHLGMPWVPVEAAWFAEGITQYYSHIAQARAGSISAEVAWAELVDGFSRGRGSSRGQSVLAESEAMGQRLNYWWVYWGGAAWALGLDVALRQRGRSLDEVLRHWNRHPCCDAPMSVAALLAEGDRLVGEPTFSLKSLQAPDFPEVSSILAWLGVGERPGALTLDPDARGAGVAGAIMGMESPARAR
jgi:hypothetical protein